MGVIDTRDSLDDSTAEEARLRALRPKTIEPQRPWEPTDPMDGDPEGARQPE